MATITTQVKEYQPASTYAPLDYKTFLEGVKTVRDRYDRGQVAMSAYDRLYAMDVGDNESAKKVLGDVKGDIDGQLDNIRTVGNFEDAEYDIMGAANQFISDPRIHTLQNAARERELNNELRAKFGNDGIWDPKPYNQHQFYDEEGNLNHYTNSAEQIRDYASKKKELIGKINPSTLDQYGLTEIQKHALLEYGDVTGISQGIIDRIARDLTGPYSTTLEGQQEIARLRHENPNLTDSDINSKLTKSISELASPQRAAIKDRKFMSDEISLYGYKKGLEREDGSFSPYASVMMALMGEGRSEVQQSVFNAANGGTDQLIGKTIVAGKLPLIEPDGSPEEIFQRQEDIANMQELMAIDDTEVGLLSRAAVATSRGVNIPSFSPEKAQDFYDSYQSITSSLNINTDEIKMNPEDFLKSENRNHALKVVEEAIKEKYPDLKKVDLTDKDQMPSIKLKVGQGRFVANTDGENAYGVTQPGKSETDYIVKGDVIVTLNDIATNNNVSEDRARKMVKAVGGSFGTDKDGLTTAILPSYTDINQGANSTALAQHELESGHINKDVSIQEQNNLMKGVINHLKAQKQNADIAKESWPEISSSKINDTEAGVVMNNIFGKENMDVLSKSKTGLINRDKIVSLLKDITKGEFTTRDENNKEIKLRVIEHQDNIIAYIEQLLNESHADVNKIDRATLDKLFDNQIDN